MQMYHKSWCHSGWGHFQFVFQLTDAFLDFYSDAPVGGRCVC